MGQRWREVGRKRVREEECEGGGVGGRRSGRESERQ